MLSLSILFLHLFFILSCSSFPISPKLHAVAASRSTIFFESSNGDNYKSDNKDIDTSPLTTIDDEKNNLYVSGLVDNLSDALDRYILTGSPAKRESVFNILQQIKNVAKDEEFNERAIRMVKRAGLEVETTENKANGSNNDQTSNKELGKTDTLQRQQQVDDRKKWEESMKKRETANENGSIAKTSNENKPRSVLSSRLSNDNSSFKPETHFLSQLDPNLVSSNINTNPEQLKRFSDDISDFKEKQSGQQSTAEDEDADNDMITFATNKISEYIALAGSSGSAFEGEKLGIGGLDDVLSQVKRRIWIPLAAPPQLLKELGIHPVRGLLLYGKPGCGKTLLAKTLGQMLSPIRPITIVSGPQIMDKFVGSSEKNLREIFDNPPDIYDKFRIGGDQPSLGDAISKAALHIVIMDEFDAIARSRGGRGGKGDDQSDAGVARDSVVNQLLAKMDGVEPLIVPTLVIGLTNKRSLIEPALLRPGRFEVQIEVPPPKTREQRISILKVHTKDMHLAGRVLVRDAPPGTAASRYVKEFDSVDNKESPLLSYDELLNELAMQCEGMTGASLAGVARSAASHALERAVDEFSQKMSTVVEEKMKNAAAEVDIPSPMMACVVTKEDFIGAINEIFQSLGDSDYSNDDSSNSTSIGDGDGDSINNDEAKSNEKN